MLIFTKIKVFRKLEIQRTIDFSLQNFEGKNPNLTKIWVKPRHTIHTDDRFAYNSRQNSRHLPTVGDIVLIFVDIATILKYTMYSNLYTWQVFCRHTQQDKNK